MSTVNVSNLTGAALCYAVCMIEMPHLVWGETIGVHHASFQIVVPELPESKCYSPYTGWGMFGPIIEREKMRLGYRDLGRDSYWCAEAFDAYAGNRYLEGKGPTPLIAAMRCYVASKFGDEVDVPEEIL